MLLSIKQYGDPVLRAKSAPIEQVDAEIKTLAENMLETMYAANGIGLAAPQIGLNIRMIVIDIPEDEEEEVELITVNGEECSPYSIMPMVFINPELEPYDSEGLFTEGCLSVHEIRSNVSRPLRVKAKLTQLDGSVMEVDCGGLLARCLQHEYDHLEGKLFTDRVSSASRLTLAKKLRRLVSYKR